MPDASLPDHLRLIAGTRLTPGVIRIPSDESHMLSAALDCTAPEDTLHPIYAYLATQRGIGMSVAEVCALADFDINDGPMLGGVEFTYEGSLLPDTEYRVEGTILSLVRKQGKSVGVFDLLDFEEQVIDSDGTVIVSAVLSFVLPRKETQR